MKLVAVIALLVLAVVLAVLGAGSAQAHLSFPRAKQALNNSSRVNWPILRCSRLGSETIQCVRRVEAASESVNGVQVVFCFLTWDRVTQRAGGLAVIPVGDSNRCRL